MLPVTLAYDAATARLLVLNTGTAAPAYQLVRRRPGQPDQVLLTQNASNVSGAGRQWQVPGDGCPVLVLKGGTYGGPNETLFVASDESAPVLFVAEALHTEALARAYALHTRPYPAGHPLDDCLGLLVRRDAGRSAAQKNNPTAAHQLLSATVLAL